MDKRAFPSTQQFHIRFWQQPLDLVWVLEASSHTDDPASAGRFFIYFPRYPATTLHVGNLPHFAADLSRAKMLGFGCVLQI